MAVDDKSTPLERIVLKLMRAYPVPAWSQGQIELWVEMFDDLDVMMLAQVARDWIATRSQRPAIADIRKAVAEKQLGNLAGAKLFMPQDEAWGYVVRCFGTVGRYSEFPDEHPLVKMAVDRLGWREMCSSENIEVTRAQFRNAYVALLERSVAEAAASEGAASMPTALLSPDEQARKHLEDLRQNPEMHEVVQ